MDIFARVKINHVVLKGSDHSMLFPSFDGMILKGPRGFLYDSRWGKNLECRDIITEV